MKYEKFKQLNHNERMSMICQLSEKAAREQRRKKLTSFKKV